MLCIFYGRSVKPVSVPPVMRQIALKVRQNSRATLAMAALAMGTRFLFILLDAAHRRSRVTQIAGQLLRKCGECWVSYLNGLEATRGARLGFWKIRKTIAFCGDLPVRWPLNFRRSGVQPRREGCREGWPKTKAGRMGAYESRPFEGCVSAKRNSRKSVGLLAFAAPRLA